MDLPRHKKMRSIVLKQVFAPLFGMLLVSLVSCEAKISYFGAPVSDSAVASPLWVSTPTDVLSGYSITKLSCGKKHCIFVNGSSDLFHFGSYLESATILGYLRNPVSEGVPITSYPEDVYLRVENPYPANPTVSNTPSLPAPKASNVVHLAAGSGADLIIDDMKRIYMRFHDPGSQRMVLMQNMTTFFSSKDIKLVKSVVAGDSTQGFTSDSAWWGMWVVVLNSNAVYTFGGGSGLGATSGNFSSDLATSGCSLMDSLLNTASAPARSVYMCQVSILSSVANFPTENLRRCLASPPNATVIDVITGQDWVLVRTNEGLCGWGVDSRAVIGSPMQGLPTRVFVTNPANGQNLTSADIISMTAGPYYALLHVNGTGSKFVMGWGSSPSGPMYELGRTVERVVSASAPAVLYSVDADAADFKMFTAGRNSLFCYTTAGYKACYGLGDNANGELGSGSTVPSPTLAPLSSSLNGRDFSFIESMKTRFAAFSTWSPTSVFAVDPSGSTLGWGDTREGRLGRPTSKNLKDSSIPTNTFQYFATTRYAAAFYGRDKLLYTIGANEPPGILGIGESTPQEYNVVVLSYPLDGKVTGITAGEGFFLVTLSGFGGVDTLAWWGQVPTNPVQQISVPQELNFNFPGNVNIYAVSCGRVHCAASTDAGLIAWGFNHNKQIANSTKQIYNPIEKFSVSMTSIYGSRIVQIAASDTGTLVYTSAGSLFFFGSWQWQSQVPGITYRIGTTCASDPRACIPWAIHPIDKPRLIAASSAFPNDPPVQLYASYSFLDQSANVTTTDNAFESPDTFPSTYFLVKAGNGSLYGLGCNSYGVLGRSVIVPYSRNSDNPPPWFTGDLYESLVPVLPQYQFSLVSAGATTVYAQRKNTGDILAWGYSPSMGFFYDYDSTNWVNPIGFSSTPNWGPFPRNVSGPWSPKSSGNPMQRRVIGMWGRYTTFFETGPNIYGDQASRPVYTGTPYLSIMGTEFGTNLATTSVILEGKNITTQLRMSPEIVSLQDDSILIKLPTDFAWEPGRELSVTVTVDGATHGPVVVATAKPLFNLIGTEEPTSLYLNTDVSRPVVLVGTDLPVEGVGNNPLDALIEFSTNATFPLSASCQNGVKVMNKSSLTCNLRVNVNTNSPLFWTWAQETVQIDATVSILGVRSSLISNIATIIPVPTVNENTNLWIAKTNGSVFTITGSNFVPGDKTTYSWIPAFSGINCNAVSTSLISCVVNSAPSGPLNVTVTAVDGKSKNVQVGEIVEQVTVAYIPGKPTYISAAQTAIPFTVQNLLQKNTSRPSVALRIRSATKRAIVDIDCLQEDPATPSLTSVNCVPSAPLSPGNLTVLLTIYGSTFSADYGIVTSAASITPSAIEYASSGPYELTIRGSSFSTQNPGQSTTLAFSPPVPFSFNASRWDDSTIIVSFPSPVPAGNLTATVTSNGGPSVATVVARIVPNPVVNPSTVFVVNTATSITVPGANFHPTPSSNEVILAFGPSSPEISCTPSANSTTISLVCEGLSLQMYTNSTAVTAKVRAYNSFFSTPTQVAQVGPQQQPLAQQDPNGSGAARVIDQTTTGIIIGVVVGVAIIIAIVVILIIRWRYKAAAKAQEEKIRKDIESKFKEMQMEMKDVFNLKASDLTITTKLGEGSYGAVYLALYKKRHVAVKKLTSNVMGEQVSEFFREAALMLSLKDHPNVVKVFGMCQEAGNFSMVMEFLPNGSLDAIIDDPAQTISESFVWKIARGAAAGMASLAQQHVVHRDLAARNILLADSMEPKVADFGYARVVGDEAVGKTKTTVGPIRWMSPESIANREFSEKSDVWAYGCMLFELIARQEPFQGLQLHDVAIRVRDQAANPGVPEGAPLWIVPIMVKCWDPKPESRPTFNEIVATLDRCRPSSDDLLAADSSTPLKRESGYELFGDNKVSSKKKKGKGKASREKSSSSDDSSSESPSSEDDRYIEMN